MQASRSRAELVASLDDSSPEVVRAAVDRLVEVDGRSAAAELRPRLLTIDLALVPDIARALRRLGDEPSIDVAVDGLHAGSYTQRLAAARALRILGPACAARQLRAALQDKIAGVRIAALDALAELGTAAGIDGDCAALLADPEPQVRIAAVRALARTAPRPGAILARAADDEDRFVRVEVARHLATLPDDAAGSLLMDRDLRVREAAAYAAGTKQVDGLAVLLIEDPSPDVRHAAAKTLGSLGDARIADLLVPALEDPDAIVRVAVVRALDRLVMRAGAVRRLRRELLADRPERRRACVYALARLEAREAAREVSRLVDDPDVDVRLALIQSAESLLPDPKPMIHYLAEDEDSSVRHAAEMWLLRREDGQR